MKGKNKTALYYGAATLVVIILVAWHPNQGPPALAVIAGSAIEWITDWIQGHHPEVIVFIFVGLFFIIATGAAVFTPVAAWVIAFLYWIDDTYRKKKGYPRDTESHAILAHLGPPLACGWLVWAMTGMVSILANAPAAIGWATWGYAVFVFGLGIHTHLKFRRLQY